jgi:hypothetical protein
LYEGKREEEGGIVGVVAVNIEKGGDQRGVVHATLALEGSSGVKPNHHAISCEDQPPINIGREGKKAVYFAIIFYGHCYVVGFWNMTSL